MPERKKIKKTKDVDMQAIEGGGMIYIPKKRKRKTILPKSYNPENPGPMPDPERWLPRYERKKYRKFMRKHGKYTKRQGAMVDDLP